MRFVKFKCGCGCVFIADSMRHHMDYCPKCKMNAVDLEEDCCRFIGNIEPLEEFNAPWFDSWEEYYSAFLGWLNDSDEEYTMYKEEGVLNVIKLSNYLLYI